MTPTKRGPLYPDRLPVGFSRVEPDTADAPLVRWWWTTSWDLAPGETSEQHVLAFTASNLTVEPRRAGVSGPTTRASTHTLEGSGWVVGALLQPAAMSAFTANPGDLRDAYRPINDPALVSATAAALREGGFHEAIAPLTKFLWEHATLNDEALLANRLAQAVEATPRLATVDQLADALAVSTRTVHRLAARYVGVTPYAMIRRRRLQEAAELIRSRWALADVAAECGFTDQAHFAREFRSALGMPPSRYRDNVQGS